MTVQELIQRARAAAEKPTKYSLGSGATYTAPHPAGDDGACDCSGFVAWALGYARYQPGLAWLVKLNGGWVNTDGIVSDTMQPTGLYEPRSKAAPGAIVVYPSQGYALRYLFSSARGPKIGHVGIVTSLNKNGYSVIHCSAGNFRKFGNAIAETDYEVFERVAYRRFAWAASVGP